MKTLAGWIERHAAFDADKPALRFESQVWSYAELAARIARLTQWLEDELELSPGSRVAWLGHNHPDLIALLFACAHAGMILVPLNWRLSAAELNAVLADAGPAAVVVDESCAEFCAGLEHARCVTRGWRSDGALQVPDDRASAALGTRDVDCATPALLVYTSGTTGRARGAVLSQQALLFNALNAVHMHDLGAGDRVLTVLPMFHVGGLNIQSLPALYCGAELVLTARFDALATLAAINNLRPSLTTLVPAMLSAMMAAPGWAGSDLSSLRAIATGSTDVPRALIDAVHARAIPVIQIYGATETGPVAIYQRIAEAFATAGSIGRAGLHTEVRLLDAEGNEVPAGSAGEIALRGPHLASGYWDHDSARALPFADGWFRSGDVASRGHDGLFWFRDRIKHVIISGGENIYPAELERILNASGLLLEAAVAGRRDERWGEVPVVVAVRARAGVEADAVLALFDGELARYKRPREVMFVEALPRNALGKVEVPRVRALVNGDSSAL